MTTPSDLHQQQLYQPQPRERQLTLRAVLVGCLLGGLVTIVNTYFGLQTGWSTSGSLIAAILGYGLFAILPLKKPYSVLENNITQTAGSAAAIMAPTVGVMTVLPALKMLGHPLSISGMYLWSIAVAFLGVFFAVPLRKQMIVVEKLRFPTGTITAETILAMHHAESDAVRKARTLLAWGIFSGAYTLLSYFIPVLHKPPLLQWLGLGFFGVWGFSLFVSPLLMGAGMVIGPRVGLSLLLGSILSWGILGPYAKEMQWVTGEVMDYKNGVAGWVLWPGVALMVGNSVTALLLSLPRVLRAYQRKHLTNLSEKPEWQIPLTWWLSGLVCGSILCMLVMDYVFNIPFYFTLIAIAISWVLAMIAARSLGETDINPLSAIGKVIQLAYGGIAPGQSVTNLMAAGISSAGAAAGGDMLQDWKTGYLLGASPRSQFFAQCAGILAGMLFVIPVYLLFDAAYTIGEQALPAPSAHAWRAMAELLSQGWQTLPAYVDTAVVVALIAGVVLAILRRIKTIAEFVPAGLAVGIAFIIPAYYSIIMCIGSLILLIWYKRNPISADNFGFPVAAGLMIGEGLMGVVIAVLTLLGVKPWF